MSPRKEKAVIIVTATLCGLALWYLGELSVFGFAAYMVFVLVLLGLPNS